MYCDYEKEELKYSELKVSHQNPTWTDLVLIEFLCGDRPTINFLIREQHINPLNPELNPICYLLALLVHHFLNVRRIRVKSLTLRLLMSYIYIYGAPILDVFVSHTTTQHSR